MLTSPQALITIACMVLVSVAIKASGLLLANRLPQTGFVAAWLRYIPGAVLASLVAPTIASGNAADIIAAAATALLFLLSRNLFVAMAAGVLTVFLARLALGG